MRLTQPPPTTPSFAKSAIPLLLTLRPSRVYIACILQIHLLAVIACWISAIAVVIKLLISALLVLSLCYNIKEALTAHQIIWRAGNHWSINEDSLKPINGQLTSIDFLSRWLVIITLKENHKRSQRFLIPFDAVNADSYRLLRVRLRIEGHSLLNPQEDP